ncbi:hypothetical protein ACZ91_61440, partial [Streptomyces regensis]
MRCARRTGGTCTVRCSPGWPACGSTDSCVWLRIGPICGRRCRDCRSTCPWPLSRRAFRTGC